MYKPRFGALYFQIPRILNMKNNKDIKKGFYLFTRSVLELSFEVYGKAWRQGHMALSQAPHLGNVPYSSWVLSIIKPPRVFIVYLELHPMGHFRKQNTHKRRHSIFPKMSHVVFSPIIPTQWVPVKYPPGILGFFSQKIVNVYTQ